MKAAFLIGSYASKKDGKEAKEFFFSGYLGENDWAALSEAKGKEKETIAFPGVVAGFDSQAAAKDELAVSAPKEKEGSYKKVIFKITTS